jgi:hypothetical protein
MYDASVQLHALSLAVSLSKVSKQEQRMPRTPVALLRSGCFGTGDNQSHTYLTASLFDLGRYSAVVLLGKAPGRELPPEVRAVAAGWVVLLARSLHAAAGILQRLHRGAVATAESVPVTSSRDISSSSHCLARLPGGLAICICSAFDRLRYVLTYLKCLNEHVVDTGEVLRHWDSSSSTTSSDSDSISGGSSSSSSSGKGSSSGSCQGVDQSLEDVAITMDQHLGGQEAASVSKGASLTGLQPAGPTPSSDSTLEQVGRVELSVVFLHAHVPLVPYA